MGTRVTTPVRKLSTLEQTILGIVWLRGPCSTYAVMRELETSESTYHRSRASTTYSITKRLLRFGLLEPTSEGEGWVRLTAEGKALLHDWLAPPVPMADIAHSADFLRLRFFFLGALSPQDRVRFIDESIAGLRDLAKTAERLVLKNEEIGDYYGAIATLSMILETRARIQWLTLAREWVNLEPASGYGQAMLDRVMGTSVARDAE